MVEAILAAQAIGRWLLRGDCTKANLRKAVDMGVLATRVFTPCTPSMILLQVRRLFLRSDP